MGGNRTRRTEETSRALSAKREECRVPGGGGRDLRDPPMAVFTRRPPPPAHRHRPWVGDATSGGGEAGPQHRRGPPCPRGRAPHILEGVASPHWGSPATPGWGAGSTASGDSRGSAPPAQDWSLNVRRGLDAPRHPSRSPAHTPPCGPGPKAPGLSLCSHSPLQAATRGPHPLISSRQFTLPVTSLESTPGPRGHGRPSPRPTTRQPGPLPRAPCGGLPHAHIPSWGLR